MPTVSNDTNDGYVPEYNLMQDIKCVMDYGSLNYFQALNLPCDVFKLMMKNYFIDKCMQSEQGRQYLTECDAYSRTQPDIDGLEKAFKINYK